MREQVSFLSSLRESMGLSYNGHRTLEDYPGSLQSDFSTVPQIDSGDDLLAILKESCARHNMSLHVVDDGEQAAEVIVKMVHEETPEFYHNKHVAVHNHPLLSQLKIWKRFENESITVHTCMDNDSDAREKHELSCIGITSPECVVATHATVIQQTGIGQPRSTSLLPSHHIAVVKQERIVKSLEEGYVKMKAMQGSNFVFISGPSKTADIEAQLVYGAHGPRKMDLIIIK